MVPSLATHRGAQHAFARAQSTQTFRVHWGQRAQGPGTEVAQDEAWLQKQPAWPLRVHACDPALGSPFAAQPKKGVGL
eukprot:1138503-Pelagomonas_calceolata.AAC.9